MKKILSGAVVLGLMVGVGSAQTLFNASLTGANEVPPVSSSSLGAGAFSLTGDDLTYSVTAYLLATLPTDAGVFGPANTGQVAPMIFDLGAPTVTPLGPLNYVSYSGVATLTAPEVTELEAGFTYVNVFTTAYPTGGEIRGQLTVVPEPSSVLLLGLGAGITWLARRKNG